MRLPRWFVIPLVLIVGCGDEGSVDDTPLTEGQVDAVLAAATPTQDDLPDSFDWELSDDNPAYLDFCADAATELVGSVPGAISTRRSDPWAGDRLGETGDLSDPSFVQVLGSATVFASGAEASTALELFDEDAFVGCMQDGIAADVRGYEDEAAGGGSTDGVDFDARSETLGNSSTIRSAYFSAAVVAGFDDFEEVDVSLTRVGPTVLVIAVWASAQNLSPGTTGDLTLDIAGTVADQMQAALD